MVTEPERGVGASWATPIRAAGAILLVVVGVLAGLEWAARSSRASGGAVDAADWVDCAGHTPLTRESARRLAQEAAGRTLIVPARCTVRLEGPEPGGTGFIIPDGTKVICEPGGGFAAATRACTGGRYPGAACREDADCLGGGRCAGTAFAPSDTATYTMIGAAIGAGWVGLEGCDVRVEGLDPASFTCDGGTNAGRPCRHTCAGRPTLTCASDVDCRAADAGACLDVADCATATPTPGHCTAAPGSPSGGGRIVAIDVSAAQRARVERVRIVDHRRGTSLVLGDGVARDIDNTVETATRPIVVQGAVTEALYALDPGVLISGGGRLTQSTLRGATQAVLLTGERASVSHSTVSAVAPGGVGVRAAGTKQRVSDVDADAEDACVQLAGPQGNTFSRVTGLSCSGRNPKKTMGVEIVSGGQYAIGGDFLGVFNPIYQGHLAGNFALDFTTRMAFGCGPKVVLQSFGGRVSGYSAWGSGGCGYCAGGTAAKRVCDVADDCGEGGLCFGGRCVNGPRSGRACDCPSSTCTPFPDILIGTWKPKMAPAVHAEIRGAIVHTSVPNVALVATVPPEKRCSGGARAFETCIDADFTACPNACGPSAHNAGTECRVPSTCTCGADADCPGGTCVSGSCSGGAICGGGRKCRAQVHSDVVFSDVKVLAGQTGAIGYDFSNFGADASCRNCVVSGGEIGLSGTGSIGMRFPTDVAGLSNFQMRGVAFGRDVEDKLRDWSWSMGSIVASGPLDPDDDQVMPLLYVNDAGSGLVAGDVVELSPRRANAVRRTTPRSTVPIGCILDSPAEGAVGQVASSGIMTCRATDAPIAIGTRLRVASRPGALEAAAPTEHATAQAQAASVDMGDHHAVRVTLTHSAGSRAGR